MTAGDALRRGRRGRTVGPVVALLVASWLVARAFEPTLHVRATDPHGWALGVRRARTHNGHAYPFDLAHAELARVPHDSRFLPLHRLSPRGDLPLAAPTYGDVVSLRALGWMMRGLRSDAERAAIDAELRALIPSVASLPGSDPEAEPMHGPWSRIDERAWQRPTSLAPPTRREWPLDLHDHRLTVPCVVAVAPDAERARTGVRLRLPTQQRGYYLPLESVAEVWIDRENGRILVVQDAPERRIVVHLPSRVLLLDTGAGR